MKYQDEKSGAYEVHICIDEVIKMKQGAYDQNTEDKKTQSVLGSCQWPMVSWY